MAENKKKLAEKIAALRQEKGLSLEDMAEGDFGVTPEEMEAVESGTHEYDIEILVRLAYQLKTKIQNLVTI